jgi:hypothetical protein
VAIVEQQPPIPARNLTDAEQDNAIYYHEHRLDDLNGLYVPGLQARLNALIDWAEQAQAWIEWANARLGRGGFGHRSDPPNPPPNLTSF